MGGYKRAQGLVDVCVLPYCCLGHGRPPPEEGVQRVQRETVYVSVRWCVRA